MTQTNIYRRQPKQVAHVSDYAKIVVALGVAVLTVARAHGQSAIDLSRFELSGVAQRLSDRCVRLTHEDQWVSGSMWHKDAIDLRAPFTLEMDLVFGCEDRWGADGIVFAFSPHAGLTGYWGEGMGFAGLRPSIGVEIDTWQNFHLDDPEEDHIALLQHGYVHHATNLAGPIAIPNVEDCRPHRFVIAWQPESSQLSVVLDARQVIKHKIDLVSDIFFGRPLVYWGVTAATGRYTNRHDICFEKLDFVTPLRPVAFHPTEARMLLKGRVSTVDIPFAHDHTIDRNATADLRRIMHFMKENPQHEIHIESYFGLGSAEVSKEISQQRADQIADLLKTHGISSKRIYSYGLGLGASVPGMDEVIKQTQQGRIDIRFSVPRT